MVTSDVRSVPNEGVTEISSESPRGETETVGPRHQVPGQLGASFPLSDPASGQDDGQRAEDSVGETQGGCQ